MSLDRTRQSVGLASSPVINPNQYVSSENETVVAGSFQLIVEDFYEIASNFVTELAADALLFIQSTTSEQGIVTSGTDAWGAWLEIV